MNVNANIGQADRFEVHQTCMTLVNSLQCLIMILVCFSLKQFIQNSMFQSLLFSASLNLPKIISLSPTYSSIMCYNCETSSSISSIFEGTVTLPTILLPYKQNKFFLRIPFITTKAPLKLFKPEAAKVICRPLPTKTPNEIRFFMFRDLGILSQSLPSIYQISNSSIMYLYLNFTYTLDLQGLSLPITILSLTP